MRHLLLALMPLLFTLAHAQRMLPQDASGDVPLWEQTAYEDEATGFTFPKLLFAYTFQRKVDYGDPRLGYGLEYMEVTGTKASVIIYDLGLQGIRDGITDPRVLQELRKIDDSIARQVQIGQYREAKQDDGVPTLSNAWLQVNHEILLPDGTRLNSYSFVRGQNGKFVKIRVSGTSGGSLARLPAFLLGVSRAVGLLKDNNAS